MQGGEYSTTDPRPRLRVAEAQLTRADRLGELAIVDSLARYKQPTRIRDPALQERIAREQFGMVRDKELLYQLRRSPGFTGRKAGRSPHDHSGESMSLAPSRRRAGIGLGSRRRALVRYQRPAPVRLDTLIAVAIPYNDYWRGVEQPGSSSGS